MSRYRITLEYDGTNYAGWQRQKNGVSIQSVLEEALFEFCGDRVEAIAAGRTDAGVHALGQTVHFDLSRERRTDVVRDALNAHLRPAPIVVVDAVRAADDFHARFSAVRRTYRYHIINRRAPLVHDRGRAWHVPTPLDARAMADAAKELVGRYDFSSFRAAECQAKSPLKTLDALDVTQSGSRISVEASARSFLHNQVRIMVGTLKMVGEGKWSPLQVAELRAACDRRRAGPTAPAAGLFLVEVDYD